MRNKLILVCSFLFAMLTSCNGWGYLDSLQDSRHSRHAKDYKKIVCINPTYISGLRKGMSPAEAVKDNEAQCKKFQGYLSHNAKIAKFDLQFVDGRSLKPTDQDYFNELAPLLNQMVAALELQGVIKHPEKEKRLGQIFEGGQTMELWEMAPMVDSRYSVLSKKYGTPLFMYASLTKRRGWGETHTVWRAIIANVDAGTLTRAECRTSGFRIRKDILDSMIFDFFNSLRHTHAK